jgi:hypothetical protein
MNAPSKGEISIEQAALRGLAFAADRGLTVRECRDLIEDHHGSMSGVLSMLHYEEDIALMEESRDGCHIYVLPQYVNGRATVEHRGLQRQTKQRAKAVLAVVERYMVPRDDLKPGMISDQSKGERFPALMARDIRAAWGEIK